MPNLPEKDHQEVRPRVAGSTMDKRFGELVSDTMLNSGSSRSCPRGGAVRLGHRLTEVPMLAAGGGTPRQSCRTGDRFVSCGTSKTAASRGA